MKQSVTFFARIFMVVLSFSMVAISCSKKDSDAGTPVAAFAGNFAVADDDDPYTLKIESKGDNKFQIKNFGGFLNVPINAVANGNQLNIPSQTFKNPNGNSLTVVGTAVLSTKVKKDDFIKVEYAVSGYTSYSGTIEGLRN